MHRRMLPLRLVVPTIERQHDEERLLGILGFRLWYGRLQICAPDYSVMRLRSANRRLGKIW